MGYVGKNTKAEYNMGAQFYERLNDLFRIASERALDARKKGGNVDRVNMLWNYFSVLDEIHVNISFLFNADEYKVMEEKVTGLREDFINERDVEFQQLRELHMNIYRLAHSKSMILPTFTPMTQQERIVDTLGETL